MSAAKKCVLQDWVMGLGLRHQGMLLTAVRGCDVVPKDCPSKALTRSLRCAILNPHCADPKKAATFIEWVPLEDLHARMTAVAKSHDHLPHHYLMHLIHAAEVIGYKGPRFNPDGTHNEWVQAEAWVWFYAAMCRKFHMNVETVEQMDERLNADEKTFAALDRA